MQPLHVDGQSTPHQSRQGRQDKVKFSTQANALLRKNAVFQLRNRRTNARLIFAPVLFILLLYGIQQAVNHVFNGRDYKCGCECLRCCDIVADGSSVCRDATAAAPCLPDFYTGDCKTYNDSNCAVQFSDAQQIGYCDIPEPSTWPPLMQVAAEEYRAEPYRPAAAMLYTADNLTTGEALAANLLTSPILDNSALLANVSLLFSQGLNMTPVVINADGLSLLGYDLGTAAQPDITDYFLDKAFTGDQAVYNMESSCSGPGPAAATSFLNTVFAQVRNGGAAGNITTGGEEAVCLADALVQQPNVSAVNRLLYCGFYQAACNTSNPYATNAYIYGFNFANTTRSFFSLDLHYNNTNAVNSTQGPPYATRLNKGLNMATNAFLSWSLGPGYNFTLLGLSEMPKPGTKLSLDFASLLGPIFFTWLVQQLLPFMLVTLVTEKERGLRIMMKMHGLGDFAYYCVQYVWYMCLYILYIIILLAVGSAVNIGFFRDNGYGLQILFYFVWGNCMVSLGFMMSTFFTNTRTAVVVAYLWVVGTGLLGYLMLEQFIERGDSWVWVLEIFPSFALYRGLYEFAQYAFLHGYGSGKGLNFSNLNDGFNGLSVAMGIMAIEWALFLVLAVYFDQVLYTGVGVRKPWLFFLNGLRHRRGNKVSVAQPVKPDPNNAVVCVEGMDVAEERQRVEALGKGDASTAIVLRDLCKVYPSEGGNPAKVAVECLSLAIGRGEVFGLLGPNGAGKTSAINMLVGLLEPTAGTAIVEGIDIREDMDSVYARMGVCPQHDQLWDQLTAREHLLFYGRLKNLKGQELEDAVNRGLQAVNLHRVANKRSGEFSGGMKRRLSVAISFMGNPAIIYLDEPSTGLDPASRRNLWDVVKAGRAGRGIILTTHSMQEAEVLCDRLGIFVDGRLVCIGPPKEITARYGKYLVFTVTVPAGPAELQAADELVTSMSPSARRTYALGGTQKYELPTSEVSLSMVFTTMEQAQRQSSLQILDWGVANATLEEVFIKFARSIGAESGA